MVNNLVESFLERINAKDLQYFLVNSDTLTLNQILR